MNLNRIDRIFFFLISLFVISGYFLWCLYNIVRTNRPEMLIITLVLSVGVSIFLMRNYSFPKIRIQGNTVIPYLIFLFFLGISAFYLFEPVFSHPYSAFGVPNKDTHDGITAFIALYGYPPQSYVTPENTFVPPSAAAPFLGYPNALHSYAAALNVFGIFPFHSMWIVVCMGLLVSSIAIFLIAKTMSGNSYYAAVVGGLFAVSSFRIPYTAVTSVAMLYAFTLFVPALLLCLTAVYNQKNAWSFILPAVSIALMAVSYYYGVALMFGGLLVLLCVLFVAAGDYTRLKLLVRIMAYSVPLVLFSLFFLDRAYWQVIRSPEMGFDPNDLSLMLPPADKPIYMVFYIISMIGAGIALFKKKWKTDMKGFLTLYLFLINIGLLLLIPYDMLSHGMGGSMNMLKTARLMLLQPFFFIFFLAGFSQAARNRFVQILSAVAVIALCFVIRVEIPLYRWIPAELQASFYNRPDQNKPITLISDMRLFVDDQLWSKELIAAFAYLRKRHVRDNSVFVWHDIDPVVSEWKIALWGSVYIGSKILDRTDLNTLTEMLDTPLLSWYRQQHIDYILLLYPRTDNIMRLKKYHDMRLVWSNQDIFLFQFTK